ncbi:MAG TPA: dihydrofolate reductase [Thermoanaerobaculia bacterium]|nr:dihydrofolate reductase [Thermoanaerobaculia bacterium]
MISIIVAVSDNGVIGRDNALPWRLSADLKRFKRITMGHHLVMGRKTFESIGRPLPGRTTIVVSRQPSLRAEGAIVAPSLDAAIAAAGDDEEIFIAGGAEIYRQAIEKAGRIYLTRVHAQIEGDATFPPLDAGWREIARESHPAGERNEYPFSFCVLERGWRLEAGGWRLETRDEGQGAPVLRPSSARHSLDIGIGMSSHSAWPKIPIFGPVAGETVNNGGGSSSASQAGHRSVQPFAPSFQGNCAQK